MHIYLIRHGESTWNAQSRWQGQADPPLSDAGVDQAAAVAARLADVRFELIASSDLQRARKTADLIANGRDLVVREQREFRELDVGAWAGRSSDEIAALWPDEWAAYVGGFDPRRGDGESSAEMTIRVCRAFDRFVADGSAAGVGKAALVSHGGVVRVIALYTLGLHNGPWSQPPLAAPGNTAISEVIADGTAMRLLRYNDTGHLHAVRDTALDA